MARNGVLVVATGEPASPDEVMSYLTALNGEAPDPGAAGALRTAVLAIGGRSPLCVRAEMVAAVLERSLNGLDPAVVEDEPESLLPVTSAVAIRSTVPVDLPVEAGFTVSGPSVAQAVGRLAAAGVERVVLLPLSPYEAPERAAKNRAAAVEAVAAAGLDAIDAAGYGMADDFVGALADGFQAAVEEVFPAHTPLIILAAPSSASPGLYEAFAARVASEIGLGDADGAALEEMLGIRAIGGPGRAAPWVLAYMDVAGPGTAIEGISVRDAIATAGTAGLRGVALLPLSSTVDGLFTLYGLDVDAADQALSADMECARAAVLNDDTRFIEVLAEAVRAVL